MTGVHNAVPGTAARSAGRNGDKQTTKVAFASLIGTTIEWYDFYIYGTAAALVFPQLFFPAFAPGVGLLAALSTYAVGFLARPLGGAVFGHFGDRVGRKKMLVITLTMMGVATLLMGLMPSFGTLGIFAPIGLVVLRFVQGIAVGGEWGGAVLMAVEHAPRSRRGFYGSWPQIGSPLGLVLSTAVFALVGFLPDAAFQSWGWRVPFLLGVVLIVAGLFIRLSLLESPVFTQAAGQGRTVRLPVKDALIGHWRNIAAAAGAFVIINAVFYLVTVLTLSWATTQLDISRSVFLGAVLAAAVCMCVTVPLFGALSDKVGRRGLYASGAALVVVFAFPLYALIGSESTVLLFLGIFVMLALGHASMYGPQASLYSEMFPPEVRYSGASVGYQVGGMLGGLVPLAAQALLLQFDNAVWPMPAMLAALALVSLASVLAARPRYADDIVPEGIPAQRQDVTS